MRVVAFAGYSGSGKTTLIERLIPEFRREGCRVSVVKHAHHGFDLDRPGKDSFRHRSAGAREVLIASDQRMALLREFDSPQALSVADLLRELDADWVLVEGFKSSELPCIEVWRPASGHPPLPIGPVAPVALASPLPLVGRPDPGVALLDLDRPDAIRCWLVDNQARFAYTCTTRKP